MTSQLDFQSPQPPRIAGWLLALFTPAEAAESIIGDLVEEFSGLVVTSGLAVARSWYWRQTRKTIMHGGGAAVRAAPWSMLVIVIGGFWLTGWATRSSQHALRMFLDAHRVYEWHPSAYLFWLTFPLKMGRLILCIAIGALVALAAKGSEMVAVVVLALVQIALFLAGTLALIVGGRDWLHWFLVMLLWNGLSVIATIVGGAIVRTRRPVPTRSSAA